MADSERRHDLARTLSTVARELQAEPDEEQTLAAIVHAAVAMMPGVSYGGVSLVQGRKIIPKAPSDELVSQCEKLQEELGEGPCIDSAWQQSTIVVNDLAHETRWPTFAARAAELGVGSLISFQLYVQEDELGALNLYGATDVEFGDEAVIVGEVFASHAAIALSGAQHERQMSAALATRDTIGQAKGLLMRSEKLTGQQAFGLLVRASQRSNIKVSDVATWVVNQHEHPDQDNRPPSR